MHWLSQSSEETEGLAQRLAQALRPGDVVTLEAPLGGGKTTFVRGLARGLGLDEEQVSSPTFVLWHIYPGPLPLNHLDLYRLRSGQELLELGFEELLSSGEVVVLEWPQLALPWLSQPPLEVRLSYVEGQPEQRRLELGPAWQDRLGEFHFD